MQKFLITYYIGGGGSVAEPFEAADLEAAARHADKQISFTESGDTFSFTASPNTTHPAFTRVRASAVTHYTITAG